MSLSFDRVEQTTTTYLLRHLGYQKVSEAASSNLLTQCLNVCKVQHTWGTDTL